MSKKNLWILTEERPKQNVLGTILRKFVSDRKFTAFFDNLRVLPILENGKFTFTYKLIGFECNKVNEIFIKTISGSSSFVDFLVFYQNAQPKFADKPIYAIEETKTDDTESRNTGVYQRCSKFVFINSDYPDVSKIKHEYDIIYLDPPYNQRQYAPNYHLLETIAKYDSPEVKGISGMRNYENQKSGFCNAEKALSELEIILQSKNYKYLLLSYNNEGIMPQKEITTLLQKFGNLNLIEYDYLRFKSNSNGEAKNKKFIKEQLYVLAKK